MNLKLKHTCSMSLNIYSFFIPLHGNKTNYPRYWRHFKLSSISETSSFKADNENSISACDTVKQFFCFTLIIFKMLYALSIGQLFDGFEIIMAISREIFFKSKSARASNWFGFFFRDFNLVTRFSHLRLITSQACSKWIINLLCIFFWF